MGTTGLILFSHGSLLCGAGQTLRRHADRISELGQYAGVEVGFMNYSRPSFTEAVARCAEAGCNRIIVVPYFLFPGYFVSTSMPKHVDSARQTWPGIEFVCASPIGFDGSIELAIVELARTSHEWDEWGFDKDDAKRSCEMSSECPLYPECSKYGSHVFTRECRVFGLNDQKPVGLTLMAHGSPTAGANDDLFEVARRIRESRRYQAVEVGFLECNQPTIAESINSLVNQGMRQIIAAPYFLHSGKHVAIDIVAILEEARKRHKKVEFRLADYLGKSPVIADILAKRASEIT